MTGEISFYFEGRKVQARVGESIAAALLRNGIRGFRQTQFGRRGPLCGMGVCFECSVELRQPGGRPLIVRACVTPVGQDFIVEPAPAQMEHSS